MIYVIAYELTDSSDHDLRQETLKNLKDIFPDLIELPLLSSCFLLKSNSSASIITEKVIQINKILSFYVLPLDLKQSNYASFCPTQTDYQKSFQESIAQLLEESN